MFQIQKLHPLQANSAPNVHIGFHTCRTCRASVRAYMENSPEADDVFVSETLIFYAFVIVYN